MISIVSLWLPILLSAVFVFVVSSIMHTLLSYHKNDYKKLPREDEVMDALRPFNIPPDDYVMPRPASSQEMKTEEYKKKIERGPVIVMTVMHNRIANMGSKLMQWFLYSAIVSIFAAYVAGRTLTPGTDYLIVFRIVTAVAFAGYSLALIQNSIWYEKNWTANLKSIFDGFIYALVTAGTFGWLWPE